MPTSKTRFELWDNPPSTWRSAPFWSWNSRLDPDRLRRAVESMHRAGMGGFFMHSRYGLKTPYLGKEWFACVRACVEKADELGMKACLYDEDRYPSGAAGGLVTRERKEFRMHRLVAGPPDRVAPDSVHVATHTVGGETLSFDVSTVPTMGWHNDGTYVDTMNPKAVAEFIRVTYDAYARRFGKYFGSVIPAIFTDEPQYGGVSRDDGPPRRFTLQWTPAFPREFKRRRGYDIRERLPELCLSAPASAKATAGLRGEFSKVRYDYRRTLTELFVEAFAAQIGRWCRRHNIAFTGHWLGEESITRQCRVIGAPMPHYAHEGWPGIDVLMDTDRELITAKQCSSVADQLGRKRVLSELYGCTGWDWPLEGHKFSGDWQYACGVNFRCPHLTHYSLSGGAKRDFPASIFSHSPWWTHYRAVEDYFARLSYMLTRGAPVRDVLVIHPIESAWGMYVPDKPGSGRPGRWEPQATDTELHEPLEAICHALTEGHYDWDFGDESLLARHGAVAGKNFKVGRMSYTLVVVPPTITLRSSTVALIEEFVSRGGEVLFAGRKPDRVDAEPSRRIAALVKKCSACGVDVIGAVEKLAPRRVSIAERGKEAAFVWSMLRKVGRSAQFLFLQSHDRSAARPVDVEVAGRGPAVLWDPMSGKKTLLEAFEKGGKAAFRLRLEATGSALVSLGMTVKDAAVPAPAGKVVGRQTFAGPFDVELAEPNTLPLDYCEYRALLCEAGFAGRSRVGDGPFSAPVPSLLADEEIRKCFGLGRRVDREHQPWYLYATGRVDLKPRGWCEVRRTFHVMHLPKSCRLAIEMPERFRITVNGRPVSKVDGWWVDEDIKTIDITRRLRAGVNDVTIRFNYRPDMELEDMYLVGDFGVSRGRYAAPESGKDTHVRRSGRASLVKPATQLSLGAWVGQGLDFFGGAVRYRLEVRAPAPGRRTVIKLPKVACTMAAIHVNGRTFALPWAPFEADITEALRLGVNDVSVEVIGGRKNILGPLHVPWGAWTGPHEFDPTNPDWVRDYLLVGHGLMSAVVVETRG